MMQEPDPFPMMNRAVIERAIFDTMRPPEVNRIGDDWRINGLHFESLLKHRADDHEPWIYIENGRRIGFAHKEMRWSNGTIIKTGADASVGVTDMESSPVSLTYPNALGKGNDIKIIQDNYRWQKILEIESLASLGAIPAGAEYLEISFKVSGDFVLPEGTINERIPFGENSFVQPVRAWDSSPSSEDPADEVKSGVVGVIAGGVITKRLPVAWLKSAVYPVHTDVTITFGSENVFNSANTNHTSVAALDSTHFVVAYKDDGGDSYGIARVGLISGTTISSYGAENIFNSAATYHISVAALDSTHFVVTYADGGNSNYGTARIGLVSGTTISSYGAENVFNSLTSYYMSVAALDSTHFVVAFQDVSDLDYSIAKVGLVSETTISSYGAENVFNTVSTGYIAIAALDSTHFVAVYSGTARIGLVSGTTISSYGAENVFNAASTTYVSVATLDSTHFVVAYKDVGNSSEGTAIIGEVSGTTISSYGAENVFTIPGYLTAYTSVAALDSTHFVVGYKKSDITGAATIGSISGTTISSYGAENVFNSADTTYISVSALDNTHFIVAYRDGGNSGFGTGIVGSIPVTFIPQIVIM